MCRDWLDHSESSAAGSAFHSAYTRFMRLLAAAVQMATDLDEDAAASGSVQGADEGSADDVVDAGGDSDAADAPADGIGNRRRKRQALGGNSQFFRSAVQLEMNRR